MSEYVRDLHTGECVEDEPIVLPRFNQPHVTSYLNASDLASFMDARKHRDEEFSCLPSGPLGCSRLGSLNFCPRHGSSFTVQTGADRAVSSNGASKRSVGYGKVTTPCGSSFWELVRLGHCWPNSSSGRGIKWPVVIVTLAGLVPSWAIGCPAQSSGSTPVTFTAL